MSPDIVSYNAAISACEKGEESEQAQGPALKRSQSLLLAPGALPRAVPKALALFKYLGEIDLEPTLETYNAVCAFANAGRCTKLFCHPD